LRPVVEVDSVAKEFPGPDGCGTHPAIADVSFTVHPGEVLCIIGKTGCGKSTLVNMLLGLEQPTRGTIRIDGLSPIDDFMGLRRRVAAVFQTDRLLPWRTIVDNAALGLEAAGVPRQERRDSACPWLERVGLKGWEKHFPHQLSGGMRQRVAISRAFVLEPAVILLDEAFGHLDEVTAQQLRQDCLYLISETNKAAVVVTHNISEALDIGSQIVVLGRPAKVLDRYDVASMKKQPVWEERKGILHEEIFRLIQEGSGA
jgi:NitT/TauT family transport system ATP-binding protein